MNIPGDSGNGHHANHLPAHARANGHGALGSVSWSEPAYDQENQNQNGIGLGVVWRAIRRHWWQAATLWVISSVGLMALAFTNIKPTYFSFALLRVEPPRANIFGPTTTLPVQQIKRTHMQLIKAPDVLSDAVSEHPEIVRLPEIEDSPSPEYIIEKKLSVIDRLDSELIEVQMVGSSPESTTEIVNAVVNSYLKQAGRWANETTTTQIGKLTRELEKRQKEVEDLRRNIQLLGNELGAADPELIKDRSRVDLAEYDRMSQALSNIEFERISSESKVDRLKAELAQPAVFSQRQNLQEAVVEAFYSDPAVARLADELDDAKDQLEKLNRISRAPDAAHRAINERIDDVQGKIKKLWESRRAILEKQLADQGAGQSTSTLERELRDAENIYQDLLGREQNLRKRMEESKLTLENNESKELQLAFRRADLARSESILDSVQRALEQLQFESQGQSQISLIQTARPIGLPSNDKRWKIMAVAPVGMFLAVACLCVLVEVRSGRVTNPDDLSRARLEVLGVVPPLPNPRSARKIMGGVDETRLRRQLAEYIQSIDHLRVAICSNVDGQKIRQSVLITSAFGGEGKTTLSAQLAGRCANAGLATVVVDGDLRNPTLTRTLEAEGQKGLKEVLKNKARIEECLIRIGDGGGFHLLPAGVIQVDPSRILEGSRLGKVINQLKENYDIVIVDTAPVLPVPDALLLGRWVNGIVLAVRYDASRFQLVQRAYKRLQQLHVPVLGAVVNGVRNASSNYGSYGYGYGYGYGDNVADDDDDDNDSDLESSLARNDDDDVTDVEPIVIHPEPA
jgi:capsular exopolysaccharide synthesis family protein